MPVSGSSTFKTRGVLPASLTILALAVSGCSLTSKKPEAAVATASSPRPASAIEAMQQATAAKQPPRDQHGATAYVDPLVSARPGQNAQAQSAQPQPSKTQTAQTQNVSDFRASGRSAMAAMRPAGAITTNAGPAPSTAAIPVGPEATESAMAGVVTQPTGIQAGRNSIFSATASPSADIAGTSESTPAPRASSASGSISADAVAYAPVRRISGTSGGLFAGGPQMAANSDSANASTAAAANHAPPGIATRPSAPAVQPVAPGLW
ncbi:hypothetical protein [Neorhizobium sp. JUb45]|uniref:hypothetical protein n=1 Tax=unclassified Neorhizobium TaxID=2629175 RepID=UPI001048BB5E|nr:hypothetical protein [Neorhizobium sp. JUb45]TCR04888.1 hypothetical protein EDF70_1021002 [Neorhizobium sp. JUb45]